LRPDDRPLRPRDHARDAGRRRGNSPRVGKLRFPHGAPRATSNEERATVMWSGLPLFPEQASTMAPRVDNLYFFLLAVSIFFSLLIAGLIVFYAIKYRRRSPDEVGGVIAGGLALELTWTIVPLLITMV